MVYNSNMIKQYKFSHNLQCLSFIGYGFHKIMLNLKGTLSSNILYIKSRPYSQYLKIVIKVGFTK